MCHGLAEPRTSRGPPAAALDRASATGTGITRPTAELERLLVHLLALQELSFSVLVKGLLCRPTTSTWQNEGRGEGKGEGRHGTRLRGEGEVGRGPPFDRLFVVFTMFSLIV